MTTQQGAQPRLQRSQLAVPATSDRFFASAARSAADSVFLDLEDSVAPARRVEARAAAVRALHDHDWKSKTLSVRVNGLATQWWLGDVLAVARAPRLDRILAPKIETAGDVVLIDRVLAAIESETPRERPLGLEILIETTRGLANVEAIAAASPRLQSIVFGVGDYSIELENFDLDFGMPNPDYTVQTRDTARPAESHWNDQWHFALARIANACRAYGLRPIDGPFTRFSDPDGYRASCRRARALGFEGKWAIHPSQIGIANAEFTPSTPQIAWAQKVTALMQEADRAGKGSISLDGAMIDRAHLLLAGKILRRARAAGAVTAT